LAPRGSVRAARLALAEPTARIFHCPDRVQPDNQPTMTGHNVITVLSSTGVLPLLATA